MRRPRLSPRSPALAVAVAALVVAAAGVAGAAIPDGSGTITGCYSTDVAGPRLYLLDTAKSSSCPNGDTKIAWSQKGPAGPAGPSDGRLRVWPDYDPGKGASTVRTLDLPAGMWLVYATGDFATAQNAPQYTVFTVFCSLDTGPGGSGDEYVRALGQEPGYADRFALSGAAKLAQPGAVSLRCSGTGGVDEIANLKISAIRTGSLTTDVGTVKEPIDLTSVNQVAHLPFLKVARRNGASVRALNGVVQGSRSPRARWRAEVVLRAFRGGTASGIATDTFSSTLQVRQVLQAWGRRGLRAITG